MPSDLMTPLSSPVLGSSRSLENSTINLSLLEASNKLEADYLSGQVAFDPSLLSSFKRCRKSGMTKAQVLFWSGLLELDKMRFYSTGSSSTGSNNATDVVVGELEGLDLTGSSAKFVNALKDFVKIIAKYHDLLLEQQADCLLAATPNPQPESGRRKSMFRRTTKSAASPVSSGASLEDLDHLQDLGNNQLERTFNLNVCQFRLLLLHYLINIGVPVDGKSDPFKIPFVQAFWPLSMKPSLIEKKRSSIKESPLIEHPSLDTIKHWISNLVRRSKALLVFEELDGPQNTNGVSSGAALFSPMGLFISNSSANISSDRPQPIILQYGNMETFIGSKCLYYCGLVYSKLAVYEQARNVACAKALDCYDTVHAYIQRIKFSEFCQIYSRMNLLLLKTLEEKEKLLDDLLLELEKPVDPSLVGFKFIIQLIDKNQEFVKLRTEKVLCLRDKLLLQKSPKIVISTSLPYIEELETAVSNWTFSCNIRLQLPWKILVPLSLVPKIHSKEEEMLMVLLNYLRYSISDSDIESIVSLFYRCSLPHLAEQLCQTLFLSNQSSPNGYLLPLILLSEFKVFESFDIMKKIIENRGIAFSSAPLNDSNVANLLSSPFIPVSKSATSPTCNLEIYFWFICARLLNELGLPFQALELTLARIVPSSSSSKVEAKVLLLLCEILNFSKRFFRGSACLDLMQKAIEVNAEKFVSLNAHSYWHCLRAADVTGDHSKYHSLALIEYNSLLLRDAETASGFVSVETLLSRHLKSRSITDDAFVRKILSSSSIPKSADNQALFLKNFFEGYNSIIDGEGCTFILSKLFKGYPKLLSRSSYFSFQSRVSAAPDPAKKAFDIKRHWTGQSRSNRLISWLQDRFDDLECFVPFCWLLSYPDRLPFNLKLLDTIDAFFDDSNKQAIIETNPNYLANPSSCKSEENVLDASHDPFDVLKKSVLQFRSSIHPRRQEQHILQDESTNESSGDSVVLKASKIDRWIDDTLEINIRLIWLPSIWAKLASVYLDELESASSGMPLYLDSYEYCLSRITELNPFYPKLLMLKLQLFLLKEDWQQALKQYLLSISNLEDEYSLHFCLMQIYLKCQSKGKLLDLLGDNPLLVDDVHPKVPSWKTALYASYPINDEYSVQAIEYEVRNILKILSS